MNGTNDCHKYCFLKPPTQNHMLSQTECLQNSICFLNYVFTVNEDLKSPSQTWQ